MVYTTKPSNFINHAGEKGAEGYGAIVHIVPSSEYSLGGRTYTDEGTRKWSTAHEAGHCVGYDCGSIDDGAHHPGGGLDSDNLMSEHGGGSVDECWCKEMAEAGS